MDEKSKLNIQGRSAKPNKHVSGRVNPKSTPQEKILKGQKVAGKKSGKLNKFVAGFAVVAILTGAALIAINSLDKAKTTPKTNDDTPVDIVTGDSYSLRGANDKLLPEEYKYVPKPIDLKAEKKVYGSITNLIPDAYGGFVFDYDSPDAHKGEDFSVAVEPVSASGEGFLRINSGDKTFEFDMQNVAEGIQMLGVTKTENVEPLEGNNAGTLVFAAEKIIKAAADLRDGVDDDSELRKACDSMSFRIAEYTKPQAGVKAKYESILEDGHKYVESEVVGAQLDTHKGVAGCDDLAFEIDDKGNITVDVTYSPYDSREDYYKNHFVVDKDGNMVTHQETSNYDDGVLKDTDHGEPLLSTFATVISDAYQEFQETGDADKAFKDARELLKPDLGKFADSFNFVMRQNGGMKK